jgi:pimeloyl-ACP methyl ester carboxylesterase
LVDGTPFSSLNLEHHIRDLLCHYKFYCFDLLGYGESEKNKADVSLGIQNNLLDALADYWQIECSCFVGHNFGGTTVLRNHILDKREYRKIAQADSIFTDEF